MAAQDVLVALFYDGDWNDHTSSTRIRTPIQITRGRGDEQGGLTPSTCQLAFDNRDGTFNPRNPSSSLFGKIGRNTPLRVSVDGEARFVGEVSSWRPRREAGGDAWTEVTASGILRRLGQGSKSLQSPLLRATVREATVAAYWPLENIAENPTTIPTPLSGCPNGSIRDTGSVVLQPVTWSDEASLVGSGALPALDTENGVAGVEATLAVVDDPALGVSFWTRTDVPPKDLANGMFTQTTFTLALKGSSVPRFTATLLQFPPGSSLATSATTGSATVRGSSADETGASIATVSSDIAFVDGWRHVYIRFSQSGGNVAVTIRVDDTATTSGTLTTTTMGDVRFTRLGVFTQDTSTEQVGRVSFGHPTILTGSTTDLDAAAGRIFAAGYGHSGETAADRIERLCDEESIAFTLGGDASDAYPMGPQPVAELVEILAECERTDAGLLFETRDELGLTYRTRELLHNPTSVLTLDFEGEQIAPPLDPSIDDLNTRNDITAQRAGGSSARVVQETGPLNVGDPASDADAVGVYDTTIDVNPELDSQLPHLAGWYLHLGTVEDTRYPQVTVDLDAAPDLIEDVSALEIGDVITLTNLPDQADDAELIILGYTETIGKHRRLITLNCAPATPYRVFVLDSDRLATTETVVNAAKDTTQTSWTMRIEEGPFWTTSAGQFPLDIVCGGERMTVGNIFPNSGQLQVFPTITRSVNGVVKTHPADAPIQVYPLAVLAL